MTRKLIAIVLSLILMISVTFSVAETAHELVDLGAEALQNEEFDAAIQYFLQAAELGEAVAYYDLGAVYLNGYGVEPSNETAIGYFEKAAELGMPEAQIYMFSLYLSGDGVEQSLEKAMDYLRRAA